MVVPLRSIHADAHTSDGLLRLSALGARDSAPLPVQGKLNDVVLVEVIGPGRLANESLDVVFMGEGRHKVGLNTAGVGIMANFDALAKCMLIEWELIAGLIDGRLDFQDPVVIPGMC